ncbi:MAG: S1 RNA-binding domain-containing protein [Deltaproteobacteria bacterium]|nr:S1 RNA-binding domain-containing protein [Deltaproteobacteria bacterium]
MKLKHFLIKTRAVNKNILNKSRSEKLFNFLEAGISFAELADNHLELLKDIPNSQLRRLSDARRSWLKLEKAKEELQAYFQENEIEIKDDKVYSIALSERRISALKHIIPFINLSEFSTSEEWIKAVEIALGVWTGAVNLTLKKGKVTIKATKSEVPDIYDNLVDNKYEIVDMTVSIWTTIKNALNEECVELDFEYPSSSFKSHLKAVIDKLGTNAVEMDFDEAMEKLVLQELPSTLVSYFDNKVVKNKLEKISENYINILRTPPIKTARLGSFYPDKEGKTAGICVINNSGKVISHEILELEDKWWEQARIHFVQHKTSYIAVPKYISAEDTTSPVDIIKENEGNFLVFIPAKNDVLEPVYENMERVSPELPEIDYSVIIARRLVNPLEEWSKLDPLEIITVELDSELDETMVRSYLLEKKGLALLDPSFKRIPSKIIPSVPGRITSGKKLNPKVKSINDVKEGMTLTGIVINITKFGAFVNIGLSQEALIHVSEMADHFVNDPGEIVQLGQQVNVTVVSVDLKKGRISLSLKSEPNLGNNKGRRTVNSRRTGGRRNRNNKERYQSPAARSKALKNLENLFKKE